MNPTWSYRFVHVSGCGSVHAREECSHGFLFVRGFGGSAKGMVCVEPHTLEWSEGWFERPNEDITHLERMWVSGRLVPEEKVPSLRSYIVSQMPEHD